MNVFHEYGKKPADPELVELVDAFAKMDGSAERTNDDEDGRVLCIVQIASATQIHSGGKVDA